MTPSQRHFEELVAQSRNDSSPRAEVVDRVMATIAAARPALVSDRPLQWMAGLAAAAALLVATQTGLLGLTFDDPLGYWLGSMMVIMQ